jgi:hypothetical protein
MGAIRVEKGGLGRSCIVGIGNFVRFMIRDSTAVFIHGYGILIYVVDFFSPFNFLWKL